MEQQNNSYDSVCDQLPPLSSHYPWFVADNLGAKEDGSTDHIFYSPHDPLFKYECQIPELRGRLIRGYYHGWVILSDPENAMWSLWNSVTSEIINLPPLILKDGDSEPIKECCLSAPPNDPNSVLLLTRTNKPTFVFFRLVNKRKKRRWVERSYASQLKRITGEEGLFIYSLACCNGKIYALNHVNSFGDFVIHVDVVDRDNKVLIKLFLLGSGPFPPGNKCSDLTHFLKGSSKELFYIIVGYNKGILEVVCLFKLDVTSLTLEETERFKQLDMSNMSWEEVKDNLEDLEDWEDLNNLLMTIHMWELLVDLKDAIFFVDLGHNQSVYHIPVNASEFGGYIHIRDRSGKILYSYHVNYKTISLSSMPSLVQPTSNVSLWECRLQHDHGKAKFTVDSQLKDDEIVVRSVRDYKFERNESQLLNLPFDNLEMIMGLCVGLEYMSFRATCKLCHLAAPPIQWSTETTLSRLQTYSLISPWLMVVDENKDIITFTDPFLGDVYFMKNQHVSLGHQELRCSRFGWLLFRSTHFRCLVFFNPFTDDLRKLPAIDYPLLSVCFSAPPTSSDCIVAGFSKRDEPLILIHYVARDPCWRILRVGVEPYSIRFPTFFGQDLYALCGKGELIHFKASSSTFVKVKAPISSCISPTQYYLVKCDQDLLEVVVGKLGEGVEVFKRINSEQEWEKINSLGKNMIYVCGTTCLCMQAKTPEMENKIYFPLVHSKIRRMVFYSLETCAYHTFNGENIQQHFFEDFLGTTYHLLPHVWIEPSWC